MAQTTLAKRPGQRRESRAPARSIHARQGQTRVTSHFSESFVRTAWSPWTPWVTAYFMARCGNRSASIASPMAFNSAWTAAAGAAHALTGHTLHLMVSSLDGHRSHLNRDRTAVYSTSGISKSFLVKNSTRPVATAAGFLPGKSWLAHGIDTVSIFGIHCCSRSAP